MVLYGDDLRVQARDVRISAERRDIMRSIGGLVRCEDIAPVKNNLGVVSHYEWVNKSRTLRSMLNDEFKTGVSPSVNFADEIALVSGTAFLIAPDIIASAGHTMWKTFSVDGQAKADFRSVENIREWCFVLDWAMIDYHGSWGYPTVIPVGSVYELDRIIRMTPSKPIQLPGKPDFIFIKLKFSPGRPPLEFATARPVEDFRPIWGAGHHEGLPLKYGEGVINGVTVTPDEGNYPSFNYLHNLGSFSGASGSPILNSENKVIGIHVVAGGPLPDFQVQQNLVIPTTLTPRPAEHSKWCEAMRTDSLRWLFCPDPTITLHTKFDAPSDSNSGLEVFFSTYDHNNLSQDHRVASFDVISPEQKYVLPVNTLQNLGILPVDIGPVRIQYKRQGVRTPMQGIGLVFSNPALSTEKFELWELSNVNDPVTTSVKTFVFKRILEHQPWTSAKWPLTL